MMKIESHSLKKSFTTTLKIEIEKHQIIILINEKKNKIITTFHDKIAKYLKNLFKKNQRIHKQNSRSRNKNQARFDENHKFHHYFKFQKICDIEKRMKKVTFRNINTRE